ELEEIKGKGFIKIYNMKEWLTLIYLGKELPSKSEFDMDYEEYIRSLKKANEITDEEAVLRFQDKTSRLEYEISNLFQYNNRLIHGQIITFVPFLQESSFVTQIGKSFITNERVEEAIKAIRAIDYSLFYREEAYDNESLEIRREYVVKEIFPDIILFPVSGENGIMWQEVSGRKRNSKGRILLPSFSMGNLRDILIKVFGRYRWELCRTMQGSAWNNIKYKSLTSEYMDYIQFYRKNRDLSEDKKERLKAQIQKSRNNSKEVFVMDYEIWISFESKGAIRLNKVVREMLATYCPLSREIRDKQREQPLFADAMSRFQMQRANKVRALELLVHSLEKNGKDVPSEIQNTLLYYKEA
ncbi:MAG: hypothetical protein PWP24_1868, partial [Clostridiales bacterium]|nr:hypothetical protein [Clostridiales bacterium]